VTAQKRHRGVFVALLEPVRHGARDRIVAMLVAGVSAMLLLFTLQELGYARDEGFYFHAARVYQRWFELLWSSPSEAMDGVDTYWRTNSEHPAFIKSLFAMSHALFWDRHRLFSMEGTSYRFPAIVLSALGVGLTYLWGTRTHGRLAGLVAAGALLCMPRFFHHAHLACFDTPVVTMWLLCAYLWWRSLDQGGAWRHLAVGLAFGLALNTKHNAWFLPICCLAHGLWVVGSFGRVAAAAGDATGDRRLAHGRRVLWSLVAMGTVGPLLFFGTWPWIWHDTIARLAAYARFHLQHVYYNMEFLGRNYWEPPMPRGYAFVMTVATVPLVTLAAAVIGLGVTVVVDGRLTLERWRGKSGGVCSAPTAFWLLAIAVPYAAWLRPSTPIFGGTKHWMTAYPFIALFAGVAVATLCRHVRLFAARRAPWRSRLANPAPEIAMALAVLVAPAMQTAQSQPWGLSAYTPLVGGAAGAATLGLNRGFWGYSTGAPAIVSELHGLPPQANVYLHDTASSAWDMLQRDGRVRRDLRGGLRMGRSDVALYHHELHMSGVMYQAWGVFGTTAPSTVAGLDGVPIVWTYRRAPAPGRRR
jgi:Dolichyl-phosphate-mannose-protein mannosyltransferase